MKRNFETIADFKTALISNPQLQEEFKNDPVKAAEEIRDSPLNTDVWIYRIVVVALGGAVLSIAIGVMILIAGKDFSGDKIPTILTAIGSGALGALSGLLAPSPKSK